MDDQEALGLASRAAFRAGRLAAARLGDPGYLEWKGHRDAVAGAAIEVQDAIVSVLREAAPGDGILLEEGPEDEPLDVGAARLWIVDPICGTLNFVHGIPYFAISIALRVDGDLRVGVVHDPMREETFAAHTGAGATLNGRHMEVITPPIGPGFWEQATVGTDLPHSGPLRTEALRVFNVMSTEVLGMTVMGSPALSMAQVAAGRLHAYWALDAKPWDVAAACVILTEAGALVTDAEGGPWQHSDGTYLVANPVTHKWALQTIKSVREPRTPRE